MPQTSKTKEIVVPVFKPGICNAFKKDGLPCSGAAMPETLRCKFHPLDKYPDSYAEPPEGYVLAAPGSTPADNPGTRIAAALSASEMADPTFKLDPLTQQEALDEALDDADLSVHASAPGPVPTSADDEDTEERWVYDGAAEDYVKMRVPKTLAKAYITDPTTHHDGFELGPAYYEGDNAAFDYRWLNSDAKQNLTDRKNGYVPVKKALDNRFHAQGGQVVFGDLILARRPKEITEQRALEMVRTHERVTGEIDQFRNDGSRAGAQTFGSARGTDEQQEYEARVDAARARQEERRPAPRGGKSYAFPNNPIGRDLVAERHGSVGG